MPGVIDLLRKMPWKYMMSVGPALVEAGREWMQSSRHSTGEAPNRLQSGEENGDMMAVVDDFRTRLDSLQGSSEQQTILLSQLAEQSVEMTNRLQLLNDRFTTILFVALGAFIFSLAAAIKVLFF